MRSILIFIPLIFTGLIIPSFAQEIPTPVRAKLVSDIASVKPGERLGLGVLFDIDPGWHVYWKYPGETGLPTRVEFKVPKGYKVGKLNWPIPLAFKKYDGGIDFGYEKSLLLWTNIDVPQDAEINSKAGIDTAVSWISCKEICIPGKANLEFDFKIADLRKPANTELFADWQDSLPFGLSDSGVPFDVEVDKIKSGENSVLVLVTLDSNSQTKEIAYYPAPGDSLIVQGLKFEANPKGKKTEISFVVRAKKGARLFESVLDGLIVFVDSRGRSSGVELKIDFNDARADN